MRLLDQFRREFRDGYELVVDTLRSQMALTPSGRPAKSTAAICEKLHRSTMRLSQMQDVAGCRVVVPDIAAQDTAVSTLTKLLPTTNIFDRRETPSNSYRAVHIVARHQGRPIEVQIRTGLQHQWAELSEKYADSFGTAIKYGGGPELVRKLLDRMSSLIARIERLEVQLGQVSKHADLHQVTTPLATEVVALRSDISSQLADLFEVLRNPK